MNIPGLALKTSKLLAAANILIILTLMPGIQNSVSADESSNITQPATKSITLIENSATLVHAELAIKMQPGQTQYHINGLPHGIASDSIKVTPVGKNSPQIIEQIYVSAHANQTFFSHQSVTTRHNEVNNKDDKTNKRPAPGLYLKFSKTQKKKYRFILSYQLNNITWQTNTDINIKGNYVDITSWISIDNSSNINIENVKVVLIENTGLPTAEQNPRDFANIGRFAGNRIYTNREIPAWVKVYVHKVPKPVSIPSLSQTKTLLYKYSRNKYKSQLIYEGMIRDRQYFNQNQRYQRSNKSYTQRSQNQVWNMMQIALHNNKHFKHPLPTAKLNIFNKNNLLISTQYKKRVLPGKQVEVLINPENTFFANRTQLSFDVIERDKIIEETFKIDLRNTGTKTHKVLVREYLDRSDNVKIISASHKYSLKDNILTFIVNSKPEAQKSITYTVQYTW